MLFNMTGDVAPPPDRTSPKGDMDGAMYVCKKSIINYSFNIEQLETKAWFQQPRNINSDKLNAVDWTKFDVKQHIWINNCNRPDTE